MTASLRILLLFLALSICEASIFYPISDAHRSAAQQLFTPLDGSYNSLEEAYEALKTFEILKIEKAFDISSSTCPRIPAHLQPSAGLKDLFYALKCNQILKCDVSEEIFKGVISRLQASIGDASSLTDYYYTIGSLITVKAVGFDVKLSDADKIFSSIKSLSQSDGRWRYNSNNPKTSTYAAGMALETLAGVMSLAEIDVNQSLIGSLKSSIVKLFDSIEKYDDGAMYFDEKIVGEQEHEGPLSTTSSVLQGCWVL